MSVNYSIYFQTQLVYFAKGLIKLDFYALSQFFFTKISKQDRLILLTSLVDDSGVNKDDE